jgi:antitoxin (DNA-binding transcriptional repressor) of toxin-antitoxin stability system
VKIVTIAEFKRQLPELLREVAKGESVVVQKGRKRENVAILAPFTGAPSPTRQLGIFSKRGKPVFKDWTLSEDDFLSSR